MAQVVELEYKGEEDASAYRTDNQRDGERKNFVGSTAELEFGWLHRKKRSRRCIAADSNSDAEWWDWKLLVLESEDSAVVIGGVVETQPKTKKLIDIKQPGPTTSKGIQDIAQGCWSTLGNHERTAIKKKLAEQPRVNPVDPKTMTTGEGTL